MDDHSRTGFDKLLQRPLIETIFRRRTHRVPRGAHVEAGSMTFEPPNKAQPLSELETALLIAMTGCTGLTMPDRPFFDPRNGNPIMSKPNTTMAGRTAGSPDNAQGTRVPHNPRSSFWTTASTFQASGIFPPISIRTAFCQISREPRFCFPSSISRTNTSTA
jgi:hypothetical protein